MRRRPALVAAALAVLVLGGCAAGPPGPHRTIASPSPAPSAVRFTTGTATAVVGEAAAPERAIAMSRALFAASPGAVLAPAEDGAAQTRAAAIAGRLHVPMLLVQGDRAPTASPTPSGASATPQPTAASSAPALAEVRRLGAGWVVRVGTTMRVPGVRDRSATAAPAASAGTHAVVVASRPTADTAAIASARAAGATVVTATRAPGDPTGDPAAVRALSAARGTRAVLLGSAFGVRRDLDWAVAAARTGWTYPGGAQRAFDGRSLHVALYGTPGHGVLGVLGRQDGPATIKRVRALVAQYAPLTDRRVSPMLEIIATVASGGPTDNGDYSSEIDASRLEPYVDAALAAHVPVILDLQPGRSDFLTQAKQYRSLLVKPGVGLALDPEWRLGKGQKPLVQIGRVSAAEVNRTSAWLADLVRDEGLPPKPFVLHQFRLTMLQDRGDIVVDRPELDTLIHVDGQGGQPDKQATWRAMRNRAPHVGWGWKNFLEKDHPVLTPKQTIRQVHPTPDLITYQ